MIKKITMLNNLKKTSLILMLLTFVICYAVSRSIAKSALLAVCFPIAGFLHLDIPEKFSIPFSIFILMVSGAVTLFLTQFIQNDGFTSLLPGRVYLGSLCCIVYAFILYAIYPNVKFASLVSNGLLLLLANTNYFIYRFRGSELLPVDLLSIGTAMNVVSQYRLTFIPNMLYAWVIYLLLSFALCAVSIPKVKRKTGKYMLMLTLTIILCGVFGGQTKNMNAVHFGNGGTYYNGYILNFTLSIKEMLVKRPANYSIENVQHIENVYLAKNVSENSDNHPNIIVIMDEAYSDLSVLGSELQTSTAVSPFIDSLTENTIKGYALSSAYGGRTANSEYEFLTGSTLGFLPRGTIGYQQYVSEETYCMTSYLQSIGYDTVAMHPFRANGWMRETVWPKLGFEQCYFIDDFPQEDLMRGFVSDQEMMEKVISVYEERDTSVPLFLFGVTMQNHSGYVYDGPDFETTVRLEGYSSDYPQADQYVTLLNETDKAVEYLITYLSDTEDETIVVFFGDHLPVLDEGLYEEIHGGAFTSVDSQSLQYMVPFFIWANYNIEENTVACTSLSYLSSLVYETGNIELPPYNLFINDLKKVIPSINMNGYYSIEKGEFIPISDAEGLEKEWLNKYWTLQYTYIFKKPNPAFYGIAHSSES